MPRVGSKRLPRSAGPEKECVEFKLALALPIQMAEVIHIRDLQAARDRSHRRAADQQGIERALVLMRESLADAAEALKSAPASEQTELLDRVEKLSGMIRYGLLMASETAA